MTAAPGLTELVAPMPLDAFLELVWGRSHHYGKATLPNRFALLLTDQRLEEILTTLHPHPDMLGLYKEGKPLAPKELQLPDGSVDMVQLRNRYAEGYSIVLNGVERFAPDLRHLTNAIAAEIDFESQINVYATPPNARGFSPHFDDHHVLVLQVRGSKTWHVHLSSPLVPPEDFRKLERAVDPATLGEPERIVLSPGDMLYLPRGMVHAAETGKGASVHLTIGFHPPTLLTLISASLEARGVKGGALLQLASPRYLSDRSTRADLVATVRRLAASLEDTDVERGLASLDERLIRSGRCAASGHFIAAEIVLMPQSVMQRTTRAPTRLMTLGDSVGLQFAQALVVADADHLSAFQFLRAQYEPFRLCDLPGLPPEAQAALGERLMQDGFLRQAGDLSYEQAVLVQDVPQREEECATVEGFFSA